MPDYPFPWVFLGSFGISLILNRPRSFRKDAQYWISGLKPPLEVYHSEFLIHETSCLITINHYYRPGFRIWWVPFAISAVFQREIHWIMTDTWTFPNRPFSPQLARLSKVILRRIAKLYGFDSMPPMPPDANLILNRARSVRSVLNFVKQTKNPVIGLAPEGRDSPDGKLQLPPPGTGRFIAHLANMGLDLIPVGAFEAGDRLCLDFGAPYRLILPEGYSPDEIDHYVSQLVMNNIANQLPIKSVLSVQSVYK